MLIIITVISILALSALVWFVGRIFQLTICPICAGTFLTWLWLVSAHFLGYEINLVVPALLMGGTVVGVMYKLEKRFSGLPAGRLLLWKILFVPAGFVAAYSVLEQSWAVFLIAIAFIFLISFAFLSSRVKSSGGLEKKMEDCC